MSKIIQILVPAGIGAVIGYFIVQSNWAPMEAPEEGLRNGALFGAIFGGICGAYSVSKSSS